MRICIATGLYPPDIGGPATHTVFLEKYAEKLQLSLVVVPFGSVRKYPPVVRHFIYLAKLIRKSRECDVMYALDTISVGVPALIASKFTRKPLILRVPGDYAWEQGQQRYGITETLDEFQTHTNHPFSVRVMRWFQQRVARGARHVVVPSEYMKSVVEAWGVKPGNITRIYSVLKELDTPKENRHMRKINDPFVITTAARLVPWKGIHTLIDVVASLRHDGVPVRLNIIGDGVCRGELEERARASGAGEHVHFFGAVSRDVLGKELVRSDAFVLNTSYEGLSHQLIEVMSLGIPIITTPVGGNVELITHEETGLMVAYNDAEKLRDAILRLYRDAALGRSLALRALTIMHRFNEDQIVTEFDALFTRVWK